MVICYSKKVFKMIKISNLPVAYRGVLVSLKPRKMPCIERDKSNAGAPNARMVKYFCAGDKTAEF